MVCYFKNGAFTERNYFRLTNVCKRTDGEKKTHFSQYIPKCDSVSAATVLAN